MGRKETFGPPFLPVPPLVAFPSRDRAVLSLLLLHDIELAVSGDGHDRHHARLNLV
jgi:hypothetical protein